MSARLLSAAALERVRGLAHRTARARVAQALGEIVMNDTVEGVETNWARCYLTHFVRSFTYFSALELTGDRDVAREILSSPEIEAEIGARVSSLLADVTGSPNKQARQA